MSGRRARAATGLPTLKRDGKWTTCTTCISAAPSCWRPATTTPRWCRSRRAAELAPDKTSVREALGRALFHSQHYELAATEFQAVVDRAPTNDFALFCLGRCLQLLGRHADARKPLTLAACMQPDRRDYRLYRDRARAAAARTSDA